jgi:hypothetical protein
MFFLTEFTNIVLLAANIVEKMTKTAMFDPNEASKQGLEDSWESQIGHALAVGCILHVNPVLSDTYKIFMKKMPVLYPL